MRKNKSLLHTSLFWVLTLISCNTYRLYEDFTVSNKNNLALLEPGMSKQEVNKIMGNNKIKGSGAFISNPYKTETFRTINNESVFIFWYYTQINSSNGRVDDDELTPVVFKNGKMEGYGWSFYKDTHQHIDINQKIQIVN